jgi:lipopolysaccharide cholinephosphotransferase
MKKIWAVELDLLNELQRVCNLYGISYFAAGGTMLGAVRHNGFIPWDDDIDIIMKRSEYEKFVQIARCDGTFSYPYFWQDHITDPGYVGGPGRLQNLETTCIPYGWLDEKSGIVKCHCGIFIDVFPLDNIPDDEKERELWLANIQKVAAKAWRLRMYTHRGLHKDDQELEWLSFWLNLINKPDQLFEQYYNMLSANAKDTTEECCAFSYYTRNNKCKQIYKNVWLLEKEIMPFEMLNVPVPKCYDEMLTQEYGDWHKFVKGGSVHEKMENGFYFDTERSYTHYVDSVKGIKKELIFK